MLSARVGSGSYPVSYSVDAESSLAGVKWPGLKTEHSYLYTAKFTDAWCFASLHPYTFTAWLNAVEVFAFKLPKKKTFFEKDAKIFIILTRKNPVWDSDIVTE